MKVALLGTGSAIPDPDRGNPSQAVIVDDQILLFDCGERTTVNLIKVGINPNEVEHLFFTHLHWDHIADYGYLVISSWNCGRIKTLNVYGPQGTRNMSDSTIFGTHRVDVEFVEKFLKTLPDSIQQRPIAQVPVTVREISEGVVLSSKGFTVTAGQVEHINSMGFPCLGYRVDSQYGSVAISGDTEPCEAMVRLAKDVDLLIHECAFLDEIIEKRRMRGHSGPSGLGKVAAEARAKKVVVTHLGTYTGYPKAVEMGSMYYGTGWGQEIWSKIVTDIRKFYDGPLIIGKDALTIEISGSRSVEE
jgi:ribonuclease Z